MEGRSCVRVDFHCRVVFTCVDKIEAIYERLLVTFTFTSHLRYIASISLTRLKLRAYACKNYATVELIHLS